MYANLFNKVFLIYTMLFTNTVPDS